MNHSKCQHYLKIQTFRHTQVCTHIEQSQQNRFMDLHPNNIFSVN